MRPNIIKRRSAHKTISLAGEAAGEITFSEQRCALYGARARVFLDFWLARKRDVDGDCIICQRGRHQKLQYLSRRRTTTAGAAV
jgi:hypothetical protein